MLTVMSLILVVVKYFSTAISIRKEDGTIGKYDADQSTPRQEGRVMFSPSNIDKFVRSHGANITWEKAILSPDRSEDGQPRIGSLDGSTGILYIKPKVTRALLQSMSRGALNTAIGVSTAGTALLTTDRQDKMGIRDRVSFSDQSIPEKILVKVNPKDVTSGINLRYNVKEVEEAIVPSPDGSFNLVGPEGIKVVDNIFYPTKDMVGKYVAINIIAELRFYVVDIVREGRFQYENDVMSQKQNRDMTELPRQLLVRREDMYISDMIDSNKVYATSVEDDPRPEITDDFSSFLGK